MFPKAFCFLLQDLGLGFRIAVFIRAFPFRCGLLIWRCFALLSREFQRLLILQLFLSSSLRIHFAACYIALLFTLSVP